MNKQTMRARVRQLERKKPEARTVIINWSWIDENGVAHYVDDDGNPIPAPIPDPPGTIVLTWDDIESAPA